MELYNRIEEQFKNCINIHYLSEKIAFTMDGNLEHSSKMTNGVLSTSSTALLSSSACLYKNNLISVMRYYNNAYHIFHFSERKLTSFVSSYIEIRLVLKGILNQEINDKKVTIKENELLIIAEGVKHRDILEDSDAVVLNITINNQILNQVFLDKLHPDPLMQFLRKNVFYGNKDKGYLLFKSADSDLVNLVEKCCGDFYKEVNEKLPGYIDICVGYLVRLFTICSHNYHLDNGDDKENYQKSLFNSVAQFIQEHLNTVSIEALTKAFGYSPDYFNKLIKKHSGLTYSNYLIRERVELSKKLIANSDLTIEDIIVQCGYNNKGFFYKKFRELVGCNPLEYKTQIKDSKL